jgi:signal transduction histidine kinase
MVRPLSFRARILLIVLAVAVIPLGMLGLWLTRATARSGEELVRSRLEESLDQTVATVASRWVQLRSSLLFLTEEPGVQDALRAGTVPSVPPGLVRRFDDLDASVLAVVVMDTARREYWTLERQSSGGSSLDERSFMPPLPVPLDVWDRPSGSLLGTVEVRMSVDGLLPAGRFAPALTGQVLGLFDSSTGVPLSPLPFDPSLLAAEEFGWGGQRWIATARTLRDPPIRIVAAAPLTPFTQPFERAARRGSILLLAVTLAGLALAALLANRLTRSLARLSAAAAAVSRGNLQQRVEVQGDDEIGRLAQAFNTMTESLRSTLDELASRESLAAVGQFAASLAHEVRNALTAIRVDLQSVQEELPADSPLGTVQERALREIVRLDETVSKALKVARTGEMRVERIDLREPIGAAANAALPLFRERAAALALQLGDSPLTVAGDSGALEQLFLNLMQNAAQALEPGGAATAAAGAKGGVIEVTVSDNGSGIPAHELSRVFEPLFSTRPEGTGLGLTIARRIAVAHRGTLELESEAGKGTTATVRLPATPSRQAAAGLSRSGAEL